MNKIKSLSKSSLPHLGVLAIFFVIIFIYFQPVFEGKILQQSDITQFKGMAQELVEYGEPSGWTGSMFSGMPSYHITGYETGVNFTKKIYDLLYSEIAGPIFILLITSYLLFLILGAPWWLALLGAIATAFSSYNIIIIIAGHVTKAWALAYVPLVLGGLYLIFQKKYWFGLPLFSLGLSLLIVANHLQIAYYAAIFCFILYIGFVVQTIRQKEYKQIGVASGLLAVGLAIAVLANLSSLYSNYESAQESMRGQSELTPIGEPESPVSKGLDKDYVFAWSYGKAETLSLLIPNVMGGGSGGYLDADSHLYKELKAHGAQVGKKIQTYTYWGEKAFTSGPVYFGAIICFLFLFAFFIVPQNSKWWLLGATILFIMLAWGRNLAWFNDFMYYHFPFYSKFRTVEMALVIPAFTFPILAVLAIKELISSQIETLKLKKSLFWSAGVTGGICLLLWITPGTFLSFESSYDAQYEMPDWYYFSLIEDRKDLLQADALRSFVFILLAAGLVFLFIQAKNKKKILPYIATGLIVLVLCDLWQVDKRYLNNDHFLSKRTYKEQLFPKSVADNVILEDPAISHRVLNLNNPFQESRTAFYHKSIGGYHAAKLGRYQDLINYRLSKEIGTIISSFNTATSFEDLSNALENCSSLNMLNAKYVIYNPEQPPLINPFANGNAWFVNSYKFVNSPNEEMAALEIIDPKTEAIFDKEFENNIEKFQIIPDENAFIEMTAYYPNKVEYKSYSSQKGLAVFSEVYYKNGWKAFINGERVPISRANWILRAIVIPAGEHHIEFVFDPDDIRIAGTVTTIFSALLLLLVIGSVGIYGYRIRTKKEEIK